MKKNKIKFMSIIGIILISLLLVLVLSNQVFCADTIRPDSYIPSNTTDASGVDGLKNIANSIIGVLQAIGTVLSVAVLAVIGIKYMVSSVEERAEYKKTMMPYVIGAVMVFGITNILGIAISVINAIF